MSLPGLEHWTAATGGLAHPDAVNPSGGAYTREEWASFAPGYSENDPYFGFIGPPGESDTLWKNGPNNELVLPSLATETKSKLATIEENCEDQAKRANEECDILRRRVALALKAAGCPSVVRGYKKAAKKPCPSKSKRRSTAKSSGCNCTSKSRR